MIQETDKISSKFLRVMFYPNLHILSHWYYRLITAVIAGIVNCSEPSGKMLTPRIT